MKTAIYARVSTTNGQDPEMQLVSFVNTANAVAGKLPLNLWMQGSPVPKTRGQN